MVFPSTPGVSVRVLRTIFVPGCGGPHEFVNSVSFSHFLSAVIPFSVSHLLSRSLIRSLASSFPGTLPTFPDFLFVPLFSLFTLPFLFLLMSSSFDPFLLVLPLPARSSLPPPSLSYLPRRSHGSLVVRLLEGIPTPPPPPLEPLSRSLSSPSSSLASFFPSSLSSLPFFLLSF